MKPKQWNALGLALFRIVLSVGFLGGGLASPRVFVRVLLTVFSVLLVMGAVQDIWRVWNQDDEEGGMKWALTLLLSAVLFYGVYRVALMLPLLNEP